MKQTVAGRWRSVQWVIHKRLHRAYKASLVEIMSAKFHLYCMNQTMNPKIVAIQQLQCKAKRVIMHQLLTVRIFSLIFVCSVSKKIVYFSAIQQRRPLANVRPFLLRRGTQTQAPAGGSFKRRSLKLRRGTKESKDLETDCKSDIS